MKISKKNSTWWQILLWPSIWILIPVASGGFDISDRLLMRTLMISAGIAVMVFINLEFLVQQFYFKRKYTLYLLLGLLLTILIVFIIISDLMPWQDYFNSRSSKGRSRSNDPNVRSLHKTFRFLSFATPLFISWIGSTLIAVAKDALVKEKEMAILKSEKLESEMKFLKSQTNPHFLFNALNNIYTLAVVKSDNAPGNLLKLSDMLRYMLYECKADKVPIKKEITYINNFVDLYKLKDSSGLNIKLEVNDNSPNLMIGPLLFVPFIENAFKHSQVEDKVNGWIKIKLETKNEDVFFQVSNSIPQRAMHKDQVGGIGLNNVRRQLELMYPNKHELQITQDEKTFNVNLKINTK